MSTPVSPPDAEALYARLLDLTRQWLSGQPSPVHLVGVASGGVWLARRLQHDLGLAGEAGVVSSSLHRDDFAQRGLSMSAQTALPFEVDGARVLLVDDVLYTGRTLRAVINELFDHGRPASVQLAVLADRGGRELPIEAAICAATVDVPAGQSLELVQDPAGKLAFVLQDKGA
ncbi:MAG: bifunctional pyr operon transcriptional regulator/uracil phosphoribosyltransferase PyrR [Burkholderiales bacterium]|nr:MAG: bifunctional pyr operon transcriptional regulator/uracil phosphoribosyltransferase PyrR [Burkholderiales bacterium]